MNILKIPIKKMNNTKAMIGLIITTLLITSSTTFSAPLDDMMKKVKDNPKAQNAGSVIGLLNQGIKEQRSPEALAALKLWLSENSLKDKAGLLALARAYDQAGQWPEAVRYYQRFLKEDKLDARQASEAVDRMYKLILFNLEDINRLYAFMLTKGASVRKYGQAKKMDHWFLRQAALKKDVLALAEYLQVVFQDKTSKAKDYEKYLKPLIDIIYYSAPDKQVNAAVRKMASAPALKNWKIKLLWPITITEYNDELNRAIAARKTKEFDIKKTQEVCKLAAQRVGLDKDSPFEVAKMWYSQQDGGRPGRQRMVRNRRPGKGGTLTVRGFKECLYRYDTDTAW